MQPDNDKLTAGGRATLAVAGIIARMQPEVQSRLLIWLGEPNGQGEFEALIEHACYLRSELRQGLLAFRRRLRLSRENSASFGSD